MDKPRAVATAAEGEFETLAQQIDNIMSEVFDERGTDRPSYIDVKPGSINKLFVTIMVEFGGSYRLILEDLPKENMDKFWSSVRYFAHDAAECAERTMKYREERRRG